MTKPNQHVKECTSAEAHERLAQARTFLDVAGMVMSEEPREAHVAAALAVLAGIAAADAICGLNLKKWSRGSDHLEAVALLNTVSGASGALANHLRRLLNQKNAVHYSPKLVTVDEAKIMLRHASALVDAADSY